MLPDDDRPLKKKRLRLIVPDRAGHGCSSPAVGNCMEQWLEDIQLLLLLLGLERITIIGHSAGGAYAMALAQAHPCTVERLCLVSSVAPLRNITDTRHMQPLNRMIIHLARSNEEAARGFLKLSLQAAMKDDGAYFKLLTNSLPDTDEEVLEDTALRSRLVEAFREGTKQGTAHLIDELMHLSSDWRFNPKQLSCPVSIWHGRKDMHAPFRLMEKFSSRLKSPASTHWLEDAGHYLLFHHWPEIVEELARAGGKGRVKP